KYEVRTIRLTLELNFITNSEISTSFFSASSVVGVILQPLLIHLSFPLFLRRYKAQNLDNYSNLIGKKYKKAIFRQYTDGSFTKRLESPRPKETGILGPIIRAQINDKVKIVFKNKASRPYSMYFHGVTLSKNAEGANYPQDPTGNATQSKGIQPGKTYTYEWQIAKTDQPTAQDAQCITRLYHSAVDIERDIASGLVGPLLICKSEALSQKGVQKKADGEQHAMFAVFDENKSWYIEDNIKDYCSNPASVRRDDPKFYNSNIMHTINGYVSDRNEILGFCQDNVVQWHFSSVGTQDEIVSIRLSGHAFLYRGKYEDVLNLFPMSGESVTVEMDNIGTWLLASWGATEMSYGMSLRFRDVRCDYEDDNLFDVLDFTNTKTDKKALSTSVEEDVGEEVEDDDSEYQDLLASFYSIRSLRNTGETEETQNLTAVAWEQDGDIDTASSKVAVDSDLTVTNGSKLETFQSNYTSVTAEEYLLLASASDGKHDLIFENRSQSDYAVDHSNTSGGEHLLSNGEAHVKDAQEPLADRKDSNFFTEEHQEESTGKRNNSINSKRKKRSSVAVKFYAVQKMKALLNHVRNKNGSFFDKTNTPNSMQHTAHAPSTATVGVDQHPSDYDDDLEEEETKEGSAIRAGNLTLELEATVEENKSNTSSLSQLELSKDKQTDSFSLDHTLGNIRLNSSPALVKNFLEASLPRAVKYSSKMTDEEWNLVSAKGIQRLEANLDKSVSGKLNYGGRNGTIFLNKKHVKKDGGFSHLMGEKHKGNHMRPPLKRKEGNKNDTLSTSGTFVKIRRKKKEYPKTTPFLNPRSKKPQKFTKPTEEFGRTLFPGGANRETLPCCTNTTESPSKSSHREVPGYTQQLKPSIVIGLPHENGNYEYTSGEYYSEGTSGDEYEYYYVSFDDPYMTDPKLNVNEQRNPDNIAEHYLRSRGNERRYYIAAKEVCWNYAGLKKSTMMYDKICKDGSTKKVIFQRYKDSTFTTVQEEGEYEEHLGILGPVIRAEVHDVILEKDMHSGLIGPILICEKGTFSASNNRTNTRDFFLLFMVFDEEKSWYFDKRSRKPCTEKTQEMQQCHKFYGTYFLFSIIYWAINGITYNLQGLRMYEGELVRWHLLNMGVPKDIHVVNFHGQTFIEQLEAKYQLGTYTLLP
ncbi:hypothetical protein CIB84_008442, partial [Bambusicola thoracicus]